MSIFPSSIPAQEKVKVESKKDEKTLQEIDREKLDEKFSKNKKKTLN